MSDATYTPSAAEVKALRDTTQAGMMDCKRALAEPAGDMDAAVKLLREKGIASASKRVGRGTGEGVVETYVHAGGRIGSMVESGARPTSSRARMTSACSPQGRAADRRCA